jgi:hypothetical protein
MTNAEKLLHTYLKHKTKKLSCFIFPIKKSDCVNFQIYYIFTKKKNSSLEEVAYFATKRHLNRRHEWTSK